MNKAEQYRYINLIRESTQPLNALPVNLSPEWEKLLPEKNSPILDGIRAVLFDLYGTVFISAAGEISAASAAGLQNTTLAEMESYFRMEVKRRHETEKTTGKTWPEIRTEEIWAAYSGMIPSEWDLPQKMQQIIKKIGERASTRYTGRELALRYELAVNPVYPMPRAEETLRSLAGSGIKLGIISNAQFYTPLLFNAFFNASANELGFDPHLTIYSFEEKEAKPSPALFDKAKKFLSRQNINPEETLYIGNDMKNDIIPAANAGFFTALFAGDRRSLRLREDDLSCLDRKPNLVINDLHTLVQSRRNTDN